MVYEKQYDLIDLKNLAGFTYREFAAPLGISPGGVAQKFCGFVALTPEERKIIIRVCRDAIDKQGHEENEKTEAAA